MQTAEITKPRKSKFKKYLIIILLALIAGIGVFIYAKYYYVFGEGVKSGYLNFAVRKGNIFKTYEGKLIQEGIGNKNGMVRSNEFEFSVENPEVYNQLQMNSGKYFDLHYKEYHGVLPWRGNTVYIVDKVISMKDQLPQ
mgnify:CR=1 FL=1